MLSNPLQTLSLAERFCELLQFSTDSGLLRSCFLGDRWRKYGIVLLWAAVGVDLIVSKLGYPMIGQAFSIVCVLLYLFENISLRKAMCSFWFGMMDLYFREISVGGQHKILPINDGRAVIFACAPHVNQFVDPIVVMKVVAEKTRRHVSWMTAAKSFHRKDIGFIAKAIKAIPVVRPEDHETKGRGFITCNGKTVMGTGVLDLRSFFPGVDGSGGCLHAHFGAGIGGAGWWRRWLRGAALYLRLAALVK